MGRALVQDFSDTSSTRAKIPYARPAHEVISIYRCTGLMRTATKQDRPVNVIHIAATLQRFVLK